MKARRLRAFALVATLALVATEAVALTAGEQYVADAIAARLAAMDDIAADMAAAEAALQAGGGSVTADMTASADRLVAAFATFGGLFPPESNLLGGAPAIEGISTTAATAIWDDPAAFEHAVHEANMAAEALRAAGDGPSFGDALAVLQQTCTSCHETYVFYDPFAAIN